jgi:hypothetical protein
MTDQDQPRNMQLVMIMIASSVWHSDALLLVTSDRNCPEFSPVSLVANVNHDFNILYCLSSSRTLTLTWLITELYTGTRVLLSLAVHPVHVPCYCIKLYLVSIRQSCHVTQTNNNNNNNNTKWTIQIVKSLIMEYSPACNYSEIPI